MWCWGTGTNRSTVHTLIKIFSTLHDMSSSLANDLKMSTVESSGLLMLAQLLSSSTIWQTVPGAEFMLRPHTLEKPLTMTRLYIVYSFIYVYIYMVSIRNVLFSFNNSFNNCQCHQWSMKTAAQTWPVNVMKVKRRTGAAGYLSKLENIPDERARKRTALM